jgi:hypothetical protein
MSPEALAAERLARQFGLTYLSPEGYEKLARLLAHVAAQAGQDAPVLEHGTPIP